MKRYFFALMPVLLLIGAGCTSSYATPSSQPTPPAASAPTTAPGTQSAVSISGFSFQPASVTVKAGATVVWTNQDPTTHTVTADDGSFDSGNVASGTTFSHVFAQAGSYAYHCKIHPSMHGTIVVQ